jgi:hypothetical protein
MNVVTAGLRPANPESSMRDLRSHAVVCLLACSIGCQSTSPAAAPKTGAPAASQGAGGAAPASPAGPPGITYAGGDGSSCEQAVVISGAKGERAGIAAEYSWIRVHFPGYHRTEQDLTQCGDKPADLLHLEDGAGRKASVFFDISGFFGKN